MILFKTEAKEKVVSVALIADDGGDEEIEDDGDVEDENIIE